MGPFAAAVTEAVEDGVDCWAFYYFSDGRQWPERRRRTYIESRCAANGPEWGDFLRNTQAMENGWTPLARMRLERAE